jgi:hypothetical protein
MAKTDKAYSWVRSHVSTLMLNDLVEQGLLPAQGTISWRVLDEESSPQPEQGEVVIFVDHLQRGFSPLGAKFFRDVLKLFDLRPQDLCPNSVTNLYNFKCSVKYIFRQSRLLLSFESYFTSTIKWSSRTALA